MQRMIEYEGRLKGKSEGGWSGRKLSYRSLRERVVGLPIQQ
jgi:hypothetical protein